MDLLRVDNLSKCYGDSSAAPPVLNALSFRIKKGERVALLGSSGSGKTTLLNMVAGIDQPDEGEVIADGQSIHNMKEPDRTLWRRTHLGFVFQFFNLIPTLSVAENIALPLELTQHSKAQTSFNVKQLLDQIKLPNCADRFPDTLSGGEQQRVAIARALAHRPSLLLADEPTGNLDDETGEHILELLLGLADVYEMTMLIVTHSQRVAEAADRQLILNQGQLVEM